MSTPATRIAKELLEYLKQENLMEHLPALTKELQQEVWRNQDISIISAEELPEAQKKELYVSLTAKWGEHRLVYSIDPALVSGFIVRFQHHVIDLSGKRSLQDLAHTLSK